MPNRKLYPSDVSDEEWEFVAPYLALAERIGRVHRDSRGIYGASRVYAELRSLGVGCGHKRVARLMRKAGLAGCGVRRRRISVPPVRVSLRERLRPPTS